MSGRYSTRQFPSRKPGGTEGAERELEKGIWESEGVEAEIGGDRSGLRLK